MEIYQKAAEYNIKPCTAISDVLLRIVCTGDSKHPFKYDLRMAITLPGVVHIGNINPFSSHFTGQYIQGIGQTKFEAETEFKTNIVQLVNSLRHT
jgi:hypothetical protein